MTMFASTHSINVHTYKCLQMNKTCWLGALAQKTFKQTRAGNLVTFASCRLRGRIFQIFIKSVIPTGSKPCLLAAGVIQCTDNEQAANSRALASGHEHKNQPSKVTIEWRQKQDFKRKEDRKRSHLSEISQSSLLENSCVGRFKGLRRITLAPVEVAKLPMINEEIYNKAGCHVAAIPVVNG